jgi:hypothetical protein
MPLDLFRPCALAVLAVSSTIAAPAAALEHQATITFGEQDYAHRLEIREIPACPGLLDTLFAMETMRRLTPFVDTIELLEEQPQRHVVRVAFGVLGFHTALVYDRVIDPTAGTLRLRLMRQEGSLPIVSFPSSFEARYQVLDGGLVYSQDATLEHRAALAHELFMRGQMSLFEHRLLRVVEDACP